MKVFIALGVIMFASMAHSQATHNCTHVNYMRLRIDTLIKKVTYDMDQNGDYLIEDGEFFSSLIAKFNTDGDMSISEAEFVTQWSSTYHDNEEYAKHLFQHHLDMNHDGRLNIYDISLMKIEIDTSKNGKISNTEFAIYLARSYYECNHPDQIS